MQSNTASIEDRIEKVKEKFDDQISVDDVSNVVSQVMGSIEGSSPMDDLHMKDEVKEILVYINQAKTELASLRPKEYGTNKVPEASVELGAVVEATEQAAEKIMDCADEIGELAEKCDTDVKDRLNVISTNLFEASGFQDITGQRISKVANILNHLEERLSALAVAIGDDDVDEIASKDENLDKDYDALTNEELLHGPQLDNEAKDQAAIDALFDDF